MASAVARIAAPVVMIGGSWLARKSMAAAYKGATGREAPNPDDRRTPLPTALMWAMATAAVVTVVNVLVTRYLMDDIVDVAEDAALAVSIPEEFTE